MEDYNLQLEVYNQHLEVYNYLQVQHKIELVVGTDLLFLLEDGNPLEEQWLLSGVWLEAGRSLKILLVVDSLYVLEDDDCLAG